MLFFGLLIVRYYNLKRVGVEQSIPIYSFPVWLKSLESRQYGLLHVIGLWRWRILFMYRVSMKYFQGIIDNNYVYT